MLLVAGTSRVKKTPLRSLWPALFHLWHSLWNLQIRYLVKSAATLKSTEHGFPFILLPSKGLEKDFQHFSATTSPCQPPQTFWSLTWRAGELSSPSICFFICSSKYPSCFTTKWVLNKWGPRWWHFWLSSSWIFSFLFTSLNRRVNLTTRSRQVCLIVHRVTAQGMSGWKVENS